MRFAPNNRVRRSTLVYATVFLLALAMYFLLRPEPASPVRRTPVTTTSASASATTSAR